MALGKYSRVDGRKSTSYCSTVSIVVFVSVCLIGVWMLMSSSVVPTPISDVSSTETNAATKKVTEGGQNQFEDTPGDLPDDATKQDDSIKNDQESSNAEENQEEKPVKVNTGDETDTETETEKKSEDENNGEEKNEESQTNSEEESNTGEAGSKAGDEESKSEGGETGTGGDANTTDKSDSDDNAGGASNENEASGQNEEKPEESQDSQNSEESSDDTKKEEGQGENEILGGTQPVIMKEGTTENGNWSTQAAESANEKASQKSVLSKEYKNYKWKQCNVTAGPDYIPCLDNVQAIRKLHRTGHYEHRERHCPSEAPTCLVSLPEGYKRSIKWPKSREKIWYHNVPHTKLAEVKGHQNWVKVTGEYLTFPGGGTQFKNGALHYIDFIQESLPEISWGKHSRVLLDVGCGVASFGGYLFERDVLAMSFAPKDEHEAQVQFALERGIPAISAVMGTTRQPFPSKVFDVIHCARCRVPWHIEGGKLLLELNRLLRPGGYFVWSATPVYRKGEEDEGIWKAMTKLTKAMCWDLVKTTNDKLNEVGAAFYRKPTSNECYEKRQKDEPPMCKESDDPDASWNVPLEACMHKVPEGETERSSQWPDQWPTRVEKAPYWLQSSQVGVYGKPAPEDFEKDYELWKQVVSASYMDGLGIDWSAVRNVMDMKAVYGGLAAALKDLKLWVMNVVPITSPDTLPIIFDRGLFGVYHDWCESFNTYPRTYDLLHADHLFSQLKTKCNIVGVIAEVDRILRPEGHLIVRDNVETINELESLAKSLQWKIRLTYSKDNEGLLCVQKTMWRPAEIETVEYAIGTF